MSKFRYPGIHSFTAEEREQFFGRERETKELYRLLVLNPVVVLFGKSGTGKTSLLQAGVSPLLNERLLQPVKLRLNDTSKPVSRQLWEQFDEGDYLPLGTPDDLTLAEYCRRFDCVTGGEAMQPVLMLDQFEELFTLYDSQPEQREAFITQLAELVNAQAGASDSGTGGVRIVISIRSDFLYLLDRLSTRIPAILRCRYELAPLDEANARQAITAPAGLPGDFATPPFTYSPEALETILDGLSAQGDVGAEGRREVEAFLLQQFCQRIESRLAGAQAAAGFVVTPEFFGGQTGIEAIRDAFYAEVLGGFDPATRLRVQRLVEEKLISGERRIISERETIKRELGLNDDQLARLCRERLLREEPRGSSYYYEISHDTLLAPILRARKIRLEAEERARNARRIRRLALIVLGMAVVVAGAVALALWALRQRDLAEAALVDAEQQRQKAEQALADYQKEQAARMLLEFEEKEKRALTILEANFCPADLFKEMQAIADHHPDSVRLKIRLRSLHAIDPSCQ